MINDTRPTPWLVSKRHHYIDRQIFGGLGSWFVSWEVPVKEIISTDYGFFARIQRTSPNHESIIASMIDEKPTSYPRWAVPKALNCSLFMGVVLRTSIGFPLPLAWPQDASRASSTGFLLLLGGNCPHAVWLAHSFSVFHFVQQKMPRCPLRWVCLKIGYTSQMVIELIS